MYETSTLWLYGSNVKRNRCRNPMMINNVGGYVGVGKYKYKTDRDVYKTWIHMLNRVHEQKGPYKGAKVCQDWLCFQKFAKWVFEDDNSNFHRGYQLDKDLKRYITNNDKVYCPENCVFST